MVHTMSGNKTTRKRRLIQQNRVVFARFKQFGTNRVNLEEVRHGVVAVACINLHIVYGHSGVEGDAHSVGQAVKGQVLAHLRVGYTVAAVSEGDAARHLIDGNALGAGTLKTPAIPCLIEICSRTDFDRHTILVIERHYGAVERRAVCHALQHAISNSCYSLIVHLLVKHGWVVEIGIGGDGSCYFDGIRTMVLTIPGPT